MPQNLYNRLIVTNGDMTGNITSSVIDLSQTDGYAIFAQWTGTPVGTIKIQVSVDGTNFVDLANSQMNVSGAGNVMWEVITAMYDKVQVVYTAGSSTGTLDVQINGKGLIVQ